MAEEEEIKEEQTEEPEQTQEPPPVKEVVEPDGRRMFELVVDGVVRRVDAKQLIQAAQKGLAVLPKIQQERDKLVEQLKKSAEYVQPAFEVVDALHKWAASDDPEEAMQAGQKLGEMVGLTADEIAKIYEAAERGATDQELLDELFGSDENEDEAREPEEKPAALTPEAIRAAVEQSVPELKELQQEIKYLRERRAQEWRDHLGELLNMHIENDPKLGKMAAENPKVRVALLKLGWEALRNAVAIEGRLPGPETYQRVIKHLHGVVSDLGALQNQPEDERARVLRTLGPAAEAFDEDLLREITHGDRGGPTLARGVGASGATSEQDGLRRAFRARLIEEIVKGGGLQPEG